MSAPVDVVQVMEEDAIASYSLRKNALSENATAKWVESEDARGAVNELIDYVRSAPCHCSAELWTLPAVQCERCRLLARVGGAA
ncbi:hypothetical protein [Xanthomonas campestris]|uniref:hypothetical protein n=1 Tax=Xanthomonas campestris TaxID=339 RepID=UPI003CF5B9DA